MARKANPQTRDTLMEAAFGLVRQKGLSATSVDEICAAAGVSKGAFFHHFKSKEELAVAAAHHWSAVTEGFFETAPYHAPEDPLDQGLLVSEVAVNGAAGNTCHLRDLPHRGAAYAEAIDTLLPGIQYPGDHRVAVVQ